SAIDSRPQNSPHQPSIDATVAGWQQEWRRSRVCNASLRIALASIIAVSPPLAAGVGLFGNTSVQGDLQVTGELTLATSGQITFSQPAKGVLRLGAGDFTTDFLRDTTPTMIFQLGYYQSDGGGGTILSGVSPLHLPAGST